MTLIGGELKKLFGMRAVILLLVILVFANAVLLLTTLPEGEDKELLAAVERYCDLYDKDKENVEKQFADLRVEIDKKSNELFNAYLAERNKAIAAGKEPPDVPLEELQYHSHTLDGVHDDNSIISLVNACVGTKSEFYDTLDMITAQSYNKLKQEMDEGMTMADYAYRYQAAVYTEYKNVREKTDMPSCRTRGWSELFNYEYGDIFLFAAALILSSVIFVYEKQTGMTQILHTARYGRRKTALSKSAALFFCTAFITALFLALGCLAVYMKTGFSDWSLPVQSIPELQLFPYVMSIRGYFFLFMGTKILAISSFAFVTALLSLVFMQTLASYFCGAALFGVSYLLAGRENVPEFFLRYSFCPLSRVMPLSNRLYAVNVFGDPVHAFVFAGLLYAGLFLLSVVLCVELYASKRSAGATVPSIIGKLRQILCALPEKLRGKTAAAGHFSGKRGYSVGAFEARKILFSFAVILLTVLLFAVQTVIGAVSTGKYSMGEGYKEYLMYVEEYKGELTDEKCEAIDKIRSDLKIVIDDMNKISLDYGEGRISKEMFDAYNEKYSAAKGKYDALEPLFTKKDYLEEKYKETGVRGWLGDTAGYEAFFDAGFNIPLFALLLLVGTLTYTMEYGGKSEVNHFAMILRCTKYGRGRTFRSKLLVTVCSSIGYAVVFYGIGVLFCALRYQISPYMLDAPLFSLSSFSSVTGGITVGMFLLFLLLTYVLSAVLCGLFVTALSSLLHNVLPIVTTAVICTAIPSLLLDAGLSKLGYADFAGWFSVKRLFLFSAKTQVFGSDFGVFALYTAAFAVVTTILTLIARRKFVK